jgi:hypothetical protein
MRTLSGIRSVSLLGLASLTLAAACAGGAGASPAGGSPSAGSSPVASANPTATEDDEPAPTEAAGSVNPSLVPASILGPIVADAATRAGVDVSELAVVYAASVEFNDGSLGCPEPGMGYTQAIVPGYQVILEHEGTRLDYRASGPGAFRLCPSGGEPLTEDDESFPGDY